MVTKQILLGYELGTGIEVKIKPSHLIVTGITQESGKTTTLQALIKRGQFKAIIFKTKIGEKGITEGSVIPPYYKDEFDWEYASDLLEASRKEKLKFERAWIIKYSKTATNLLEFKRNIDNAILTAKEGLEKNVLITLQAYLDKILPELQYAPLSNTLDLREGINIMDLERFKSETQSLIIRSVLREVLKKEKDTVIVIPECWKYIPEGFGSPVKRDAEAFIRQGATNNNFLWLDSQDITAGVDKVILKQVSTWILGYQREINEIKRTLDQLPLPKELKPNANEIATLKVGHFFIASSEFTKKVYVQPSWMESQTAKDISLGKIDVNTIKPPENLSPFSIIKPEFKGESVTIDLLPIRKEINELRNDFFNKIQQQQDAINKVYTELYGIKTQNNKFDEDLIVGKVLQKINSIPASFNEVPQFNEDELIKKIITRMPKGIGTTIYEVSPLEKLQKDFLQEAKDKILTDISTLSNDTKKTLKYLEGRKVGCKTAEIVTKGFFLVEGGGNAKKINDAIRELITIGVAKKNEGGTSFGKLKDRIKELLLIHNATEQEVEQVYNHILMEMI